MRKTKSIFALVVSVITVALSLTGCDATRTITTTAQSVTRGDSTITITTKTVENYSGTKRP